MFYIIGLGLCDEQDVTVRGLNVRAYNFLHYCPNPYPGDKKLVPCLPRGVHQYPNGGKRPTGPS